MCRIFSILEVCFLSCSSVAHKFKFIEAPVNLATKLRICDCALL